MEPVRPDRLGGRRRRPRAGRARPRRAAALAGALALLGACGGGGDGPAAPPLRPNLLVIVADDMGRELGSYGDPSARTPALDALAREGLRFDAAFAAAPVCSPSRAALLTGLFPHASGHVGFPGDSRLRPEVRTIAQPLNEAGYATGLIGKLHVAAYDERSGTTQLPFREVVVFDRPEADSPERLAREVGSFLARVRDRPFFLMVGLHAPHKPYPGEEGVPAWPEPHDPLRLTVPPTAPDTLAFRRLLARMYDAYSLADSLVAAILGALEAGGASGSTLVLFTSDHGPALPGAKGTLFDPGIRVPLLARWPGVIEPGGSSSALVSGVDLLPTLLEAAGVAPPRGLQGRSLLPILRGEPAAGADAVFAEQNRLEGNRYFPQRAIRTARLKYLRALRPDVELRSNAIGHWARPLLLRWHTDPGARRLVERVVRHPREELYELETDPHELRNLAGEPAWASAQAELRERLRNWMGETGDPWLALFDWAPGDPDPFEPRETRDGPFRPRWLDDELARVHAAAGAARSQGSSSTESSPGTPTRSGKP